MSKNVEGPIKAESSVGMIVSILIAIGFFALYYVDPFGLNTTLYKVLILLAGLTLAVFVFLKAPQGVRLIAFFKETKIELRKVVWPTKDETIKTTGMIMVAVVIVAIFLWIVDAFFTWAVQLITTN